MECERRASARLPPVFLRVPGLLRSLRAHLGTPQTPTPGARPANFIRKSMAGELRLRPNPSRSEGGFARGGTANTRRVRNGISAQCDATRRAAGARPIGAFDGQATPELRPATTIPCRREGIRSLRVAPGGFWPPIQNGRDDCRVAVELSREMQRSQPPRIAARVRAELRRAGLYLLDTGPGPE